MDEKAMRKIKDRVAETKSMSFCPPTNEAVVKAWEAFDKRVVDVYDPDTDVKAGRGSRRVFGIGDAGDIIRGIERRKGSASPAEELDAWMRVSYFMGDVFPRFVNPDEDRALLLVNEWNDLMDAIANDEDEATPEIRQAAKDQKIVALGRSGNRRFEQITGMEIYDDSVDLETISSLRKPNGTTSVMLYYTTPSGIGVEVYSGWDGPEEIISAGGWVDGVRIRPTEVDTVDLFNRLSGKAQDELRPLAGGDPAEWNGKILELLDDADPKDAELLTALWIICEVHNDEVTVYGDYPAPFIDDSDFETLGLHRVASDEDDEDEDAMDFRL